MTPLLRLGPFVLSIHLSVSSPFGLVSSFARPLRLIACGLDLVLRQGNRL